MRAMIAMSISVHLVEVALRYAESGVCRVETLVLRVYQERKSGAITEYDIGPELKDRFAVRPREEASCAA